MEEVTNGKAMKEAVEALGLGSVVPEMYRDLLQPAARELGGGLVTVAKAIRAALAPVEVTVWGYDQIKAWLSLRLTQKLAAVDPEHIIAPPSYVAGPALLHLHFVKSQEELREMYANLLAASMDSTRSDKAHPAYASIIQQLSSDEALILSDILSSGDVTLMQEVTGDAGILRKGSDWLSNQWGRYCKSLPLANPANADAYLGNLLRIRILELTLDIETEYIPEGGDRYGTWEPHLSQYRTQNLELTEFGQNFLATCALEPGEDLPWW